MLEIENCRPSEAALLASMILEPNIIPSVLEIIDDENDFIFPEHQAIFLTIFKLWLAGKKVDGLLVRDELTRIGEKSFNVDYFIEMLETVPSAASAVYYAKAVKSHKVKRDIVSAAEEIKKVSHIDENDLAIEKIQSIANSLIIKENPQFFTFRNTVDNVIALQQHERLYLKTGFCDIDYYIKGFEESQLVILAARPSMGKSALALQIAINQAKAGKNILFFSFEMSHTQIIERALITNKQDDLKSLNFTINETASNIDQLVTFVKGRKKLYGIDVVYIDYLQLMTANNKENRNQEISTISRKLKLLAMEEQIPIITLSQLNRQVELRGNHTPNLSDLRESGSIEQDADIVLFLTREDYYRLADKHNTTEIDGLADVIVAKNRNGKPGHLNLIFVPEKISFYNKSKEVYNEFE